MSHSIMTEMTKKVLSDSLKKLLSTRPINKITVKDIVNDCKLTRQTFYYHFQDIYELFNWTYKNEMLELIKDSNGNDWEDKVTKLLFYIKKNKTIFTTQLVNQESFEKLIYPDLYQFNNTCLNKLSNGINIPEKDKKVLTNLITVSLIGLIIQWVNKGMKDIPEDFIKILYATIHTASSSVISEYGNNAAI